MSESNVAIRVEGLGKQYHVDSVREPYQTIRDAVARGVRDAARTFTRSSAKRGDDLFWALRDVSFEVERGTALGIVGRNGAGKSTLLRILSRITTPTTGRAVLSRSTSPLLSVGTGFHPELSGRDNVFLNGSVLGMSGRYIRSKFDEIVAFAEVERFIDTPIKHYSSGMQMRLGFAVAAFLEAEILLIDEVLAVGDAAFQKKCLAKIDDVAHHGRTVLFVSHYMAAVSQMCTKAIWLDRGELRLSGDTAHVIESYLADSAMGSGERTWGGADAAQPGNDRVRLRAVRIRNASGRASDTLDVAKPFTVEVEYEVRQLLPYAMIYFTLRTGDGVAVLTSVDAYDGLVGERGREPGIWVSRCTVMGNFLNEGAYYLDVTGAHPMVEYFFQEDAALSFTMEQTGSVIGVFPNEWPGVVCPALPWSIDRIGTTAQSQAS
ncbi:MAG: ABC transporter ATP-binding protein [Gemmatimonadaceae bacterium]